jgi:hypothetical protein
VTAPDRRLDSPAEQLQDVLAMWELNVLAATVAARNIAQEIVRAWAPAVAALEVFARQHPDMFRPGQ